MNVPVCKCIHKEKQGNTVIRYIIQDEKTGLTKNIEPNILKNKIKEKAIIVTNLQLTKDNRLIDKNSTEDTILKDYTDSCKLLGITPLNIQKIHNEYVIVDIPNKGTFTVPSFVDKIHLSKKINKSGNNVQAMTVTQDISNKQLASMISKIMEKTDKIDKTTTTIFHKQIDNKRLTDKDMQEIKDKFNTTISNISNISQEMSELSKFINNASPEVIESSNNISELIDKLAGTSLENLDKNLFESSDVTNKDKIDKNSNIIEPNNNCIMNEEAYKAKKYDVSENYILYNKINDILPYLNYMSNTYADIYKDMLIHFDIGGDKIPTNINQQLDCIFGFIGYIASACAFSAVCIPAAPVAGGAAAVAAIASSANSSASNIVAKGDGVASKIIPLASKYETWQETKRKSKRIQSVYRQFTTNFPGLTNIITTLDNEIDKHPFLFGLQHIVLSTTDNIHLYNKNGFYDRIILKVLFRLRYSNSINFKEIQLRVINSYLAACLFVDERYKFKNDIDKNTVNTIISNKIKSIKQLTTEEKKVYIRQSYYYSFMLKWFEICLYHCNVRQNVVDKIVAMFEEEARHIKLTPLHVTKEDINSYGVNFNMTEKINNQLPNY